MAIATGNADGQVAQLVEQWTENPRVGGSNPPLTTLIFRDSSPNYRGEAHIAFTRTGFSTCDACDDLLLPLNWSAGQFGSTLNREP